MQSIHGGIIDETGEQTDKPRGYASSPRGQQETAGGGPPGTVWLQGKGYVEASIAEEANKKALVQYLISWDDEMVQACLTLFVWFCL